MTTLPKFVYIIIATGIFISLVRYLAKRKLQSMTGIEDKKRLKLARRIKNPLFAIIFIIKQI